MAAIAVDHIQFSVPDLAGAVAALQARGWALDFEAPDFVTEARPYFRERGKSIAFLKRKQAAIEIINGSRHPGPEQWTPVFSNPWSEGTPVADTRLHQAEVAEAEESYVDELGGVCRFERQAVSDTGPDTDLLGLLLKSPKPEASARFLELLGFQRDADHSDRLVFPGNFFGMPLHVSITPVDGDPPGDNLVDDLGMSLIALISKDLATDVASLRAAGHSVSETFEYVINGRLIANVVARGPGGELVELISLGGQ